MITPEKLVQSAWTGSLGILALTGIGLASLSGDSPQRQPDAPHAERAAWPILARQAPGFFWLSQTAVTDRFSGT